MPILETILPVLIIVLAGFLSVRSRHLSPADADSIATFVFTYPIPLLLFLGTVNARFPENMEWAFLLSYYLALIVVFLLTLGLSRMARGFSSPEQSVFSTAAVYANTTVIGIPVVMLVLGESALLPLFIIISIHNLVLFSLGILFAERDTLTLPSLLGNTRGILMQLLSSPITASLMLGGLFNILDIAIYPPLKEAMRIFSQAAIPAALFVLGAALNKYRIQGHIGDALLLVSLKLLLFPLLVWILAFHVFTIQPLWAATALLTSAMPVGMTAYIFAQRYQACLAPIATSIVLSTLLSIISLSFLISMLQPIG